MESYGAPPEKRARLDQTDANGRDSGQAAKTKPCQKFFSTSGCPYGDTCHFLHHYPGYSAREAMMGQLGPMAPPMTASATSHRPGGQDPTGAGFKTRLCNRYTSPEGCRFGDRCHFAHGEAELRQREPLYQPPQAMGSYEQAPPRGVPMYPPPGAGAAYGQPPVPSGFGATSSAKIAVAADVVGAIIGKAGSNIKSICRMSGAKVSIREHESDPSKKNVEMEGSLDQIQRATQMVQQFLAEKEAMGIGSASRSISYGAPGAAIGPSAPGTNPPKHNYKTKLCERWAAGTCGFNERCHFAHGLAELRDPSGA